MARANKEKPKEDVRARERETEGKPSASGFDGEIRCLGKRELCGKVPGLQTKFAVRGNIIHKALETNDLTGLNKSDTVTAERIMYAEAELIEHLEFEGAKVYSEQRLWVSEDLEPLWSAKVDAVHILGKRGLVINFKTGYGDVVDIEQNWQVISEAAVCLAAYDLDEIIGALIHPHHPEKLYQYRKFKKKEILQLTQTLNGYARLLSSKRHLQRTPNAISCRFCDAKYCCPEYIAKMDDLAKMITAAADGKAARILMDKTPEERGVIVRDARQLERDLKEFFDYVKDILAKDANSIAGFVLRPGYTLTITDEGAALGIIKKTYGDTAFASSISLDMAGLESWLNTSKGFTKRDAKERAKQLLKAYIKWKAKEPSLEIKRN